MTAIFYESDWETPLQLDVEPMAIRPASAPVSAPEVSLPQDKSGYLRPFANQSLNSRLTTALPEGNWEILWRTDIDETLHSTFALQAAGRILLQQETSWQLFDHNGTAISWGGRGDGDLVIDAANGLFYHCHHLGFMSAVDLFTGEQRFLISACLGKGFQRTLVSKYDRRVVILSSELPVMSGDNERDPEYTFVEAQELRDPPRTDEDNVLTSARTVSTLTSRTMPLLTAARDGGLVIAVPDHVFLIDENMRITADLQSEFTPLAMSLDEAGRIYLIVHTEEEKNALWVLTPDGERVVDTAVPMMDNNTYTPPMVGYDHRVYIMLGDRILAINPEGEEIWSQYVGAAAGACITANDQLLVSAGNIVSAFDAQGERKFLCYFPDETLATPPVLTRRGRLIVASRSHLYCLKPR